MEFCYNYSAINSALTTAEGVIFTINPTPLTLLNKYTHSHKTQNHETYKRDLYTIKNKRPLKSETGNSPTVPENHFSIRRQAYTLSVRSQGQTSIMRAY